MDSTPVVTGFPAVGDHTEAAQPSSTDTPLADDDAGNSPASLMHYEPV